MFRNYLVAALRNLAHDKLYAAINIVGIAVGFAAALLIGLYARQELSYDQWLPHHEEIVRISSIAAFSAQAHDDLDAAPSVVAPLLRQEFPAVRAAVRMAGATALLRHGEIEAEEKFVWVDPSFLDVLAFPLVAGDPATALQDPDTVILTQRLARKFFGREDVIGETIDVGRGRPMRITAILRDLPPDTHLDIDVVASGRTQFARLDAKPPGSQPTPVLTYVRLSSAEAIDGLRRFLPEFVRRHGEFGARDIRWTLMATPLATLHMAPPTPNKMGGAVVKPPGNLMALRQLGAIGALALLVAVINFVTLSTARSGRRAVQVGVRKVLGARRRDLLAQFIGEALLEVGLALLVAVGLVEIALPSLAAFLGTTLRFDYWHDPALAASIVAIAAVVAVVAGFYPAVVLSSFRPISVLRGVPAPTGSATPRQILVALQFAITIGLVLATATVYRQVHFALNEGLRLDADQVLLITTHYGACDGAARNEIAALPGVQAAACSGLMLREGVPVTAKGPDGQERGLIPGWVGAGDFELYGLKPLAGRLVADQDANRVGDSARQPPVVINEAALREFGFATPAAAIGQTLSWRRPITAGYEIMSDFLPSEIIGVVPDFPRGTVAAPVGPAIFWATDPKFFDTLSVKLTGRQIPETLAAIDAVIARVSGEPIHRVFFNRATQDLYIDVVRQGYLFAVFSAIAIVVAALGLFGLSAFTAERRTKEIGIRKSMGAETPEIVRLLLWEFAKPVLWANLIAWPAAYYLMNRWLSGFAYHVDLAPWMFFAAGATALFIALATVSVQSLITARTKPIAALRYE